MKGSKTKLAEESGTSATSWNMDMQKTAHTGGWQDCERNQNLREQLKKEETHQDSQEGAERTRTRIESQGRRSRSTVTYKEEGKLGKDGRDNQKGTPRRARGMARTSAAETSRADEGHECMGTIEDAKGKQK